MKDRARRITLALAMLGLAGVEWPAVGTASAGIVYRQAPQYPGRQSAWSSSYDPTHSVDLYKTYDNFTLAGAATISELTWQGLSFDSDTFGSTNLPVQGFKVSFYLDSAGKPGALCDSETIGFTQHPAGTTDVFGNKQSEMVYDYSGTLSTGFAAAAGTTYWLSIQASINSPAIWMWTLGAGGDGTSYQVDYHPYSGGTYVRPGDRAFSLASVPAPPSFALCGIAALVGLGVARLRLGQPPRTPMGPSGIPVSNPAQFGRPDVDSACIPSVSGPLLHLASHHAIFCKARDRWIELIPRCPSR